jgi:protein subunit release factor B
MGLRISAAKEEALKKRMAVLHIKEEDIEEKFVRASKSGGQNVNKTSTCVYLKHRPTGIEVKCQKERVQSINRLIARIWLIKRISSRILKNAQDEKSRVEKLKRQKRRRTAWQKESILQEKRKHSEKKKMRAFHTRHLEW